MLFGLSANIPASQMKVHPELHFLLTDSAVSYSPPITCLFEHVPINKYMNRRLCLCG